MRISIILMFVLLLFNTALNAQVKDPFASVQSNKSAQKKYKYITVPLQHVFPGDVASWLKNKSGVLSKTELVNAQYEQKALWLRIKPENEKKLRELIKKIDKPVPQIWIEARIVNVDENYTQKLGMQLLAGLKQQHLSLTEKGLHFPIILAKLGAGTMLDLLLTALENEGHGKVVARPKLLVADGHDAFVEAGERVPYQIYTENGGRSVHFANAVLRLAVNAHLLADKRILMQLQVNQDKVGPLMVHESPGIATQALQTTVVIAENNTVVLGGIYEQKTSDDKQKIPWLSRLPLIGKLFINYKHGARRNELMIFITPRLIQ